MASKLEINNLLGEGLRACRCGMKVSKIVNGGVYFILLYFAQEAESKATAGSMKIKQRPVEATGMQFSAFFLPKLAFESVVLKNEP